MLALCQYDPPRLSILAPIVLDLYSLGSSREIMLRSSQNHHSPQIIHLSHHSTSSEFLSAFLLLQLVLHPHIHSYFVAIVRGICVCPPDSNRVLCFSLATSCSHSFYSCFTFWQQCLHSFSQDLCCHHSVTHSLQTMSTRGICTLVEHRCVNPQAMLNHTTSMA